MRYLAEVPGGRETPAGRVIKWLITGPDPTSIVEGAAKNGSLPFFCGDVTPREWRVGTITCTMAQSVRWTNGGGVFQVPAGHTEHPNGVTGVAHLTVLIPTEDLDEFERKLISVIGLIPKVSPDGERTWSLSTTTGRDSPCLILRAPRDKQEDIYVRMRRGCIYKVAFQFNLPEGEGGLLVV